MPGYLKGILVALANTFVVAIFIAIAIERHHAVETIVTVCFLGFLPALILGSMLGHHGEAMQRKNRRVVLIGMMSVACSVVAFLGLAFDLSSLVFVSCIPTCVGCSILERWTRAPQDDIPFGRVA